MYLVDMVNKVVHDMSRPQHECQITKVDKVKRKKIFTDDGVRRFLVDPMNKGYQGCRFCMPDYFEQDLQSIFR